jgi:hypothetical protein
MKTESKKIALLSLIVAVVLVPVAGVRALTATMNSATLTAPSSVTGGQRGDLSVGFSATIDNSDSSTQTSFTVKTNWYRDGVLKDWSGTTDYADAYEWPFDYTGSNTYSMYFNRKASTVKVEGPTGVMVNGTMVSSVMNNSAYVQVTE